jgi:hypothetical protein
MYDRLVSLLDTRPRAVVVRPHDGDAARTYRELLERLT